MENLVVLFRVAIIIEMLRRGAPTSYAASQEGEPFFLGLAVNWAHGKQEPNFSKQPFWVAIDGKVAREAMDWAGDQGLLTLVSA